MSRHPSTELTTLHKAARLAVLIDLQDAGLLTGRTLQQIADVIGVGNRSTAMRYMRLLPKISKMRERARDRLTRRLKNARLIAS